MTKRETLRIARQHDTLVALGFTPAHADALRRISMTLRRWYELECGIDGGCIERDEQTNKPAWHDSRTGRMTPVADRETGAIRRLDAIMAARNTVTDRTVCPNCGQWQHPTADGRTADCCHECRRRGFAPPLVRLSYYIQTDPRGAALYILRPGDVPDGADVESYYSRGIAIY